MPKLLIAASGTGGHLYPALAIADDLPESWEISWLGVPDRLEVQLVPKQYDLTTISLKGLGKNAFKKLAQLIRFGIATLLVIRLIKRKNIEIVFTTGGYIAVPAILAAKYCRIKVMIHESNALPGKATRVFGKFCDVVALGLAPAIKYLPRCKSVITGTPVRKDFLQSHQLPAWVPKSYSPLIVVIGGSQGAVGLNRMMQNILPTLLDQGCRVVHILGKNEGSKIKHQSLVEVEFTSEIPALLQHADLVISRAGAGAISELAICGTPAILVPYPYAADMHQDYNASYAAQFGAALIVHEDKENKLILTNILRRLLPISQSDSSQSAKLLSQMKNGMQMLARRDAHDHVIELLSKLS